MEFNGLPLHAMVVHAAVVMGPLAALAGLLYALMPRWRDQLRWPLVVAAAVAALAIWVAYFSGEDLREANTYGGPLAALVETHEERAGILRIAITVFALVSFLAAWWHTRTGVVRAVMRVAVSVSALVALLYVALTGDAGAQIAWYGVEG